MHTSIFNYNITRPYPFRWFTPVTIVGGIIILGLLSFMNFAQNSYSLSVEYADNPNTTVTSGVWFKSWPSYLTSSVRPICEPANIPVNTQFFMNQTALSYTITSVYNGSEKRSSASPSLPYLNNISTTATLRKSRCKLRAYVTCGIWGPSGPTVFNLTVTYDPITASGEVPGSSEFITRSAKHKATLFWAEALLSAYWVQTVNAIWDSTALQWEAGVVWLRPNSTHDDISSLKFFDMKYNFISGEDELYYWNVTNSLEHYVNMGFQAKPQIWTHVDQLGKSMWSAVLAELGQTTASSGQSLLNNERLLQHYTSRFSSITNKSNIYAPFYSPLTPEDYNTRKSRGTTGPLEYSPSVISTKYLCQVPKLKSIGDIFISVLLADLVLLSAASHLYIYGVDWFFLRKLPSANYCE